MLAIFFFAYNPELIFGVMLNSRSWRCHTLIFLPDLPQVFKPTIDRSSIRLSFCSLPAKIPLVTFLAGLLLFLFDGLQVIWTTPFLLSGPFYFILFSRLRFYFCVLLFQGAYGGYLYTYAVKSEIHLSPSHAAYVNSLFWVRKQNFFTDSRSNRCRFWENFRRSTRTAFDPYCPIKT